MHGKMEDFKLIFYVNWRSISVKGHEVARSSPVPTRLHNRRSVKCKFLVADGENKVVFHNLFKKASSAAAL